MTKLQAGTTKQNSPDIHHRLTNSVADSLIKRFKLCVPFVYGGILLHSFRPEHSFLMLIKMFYTDKIKNKLNTLLERNQT